MFWVSIFKLHYRVKQEIGMLCLPVLGCISLLEY